MVDTGNYPLQDGTSDSADVPTRSLGDTKIPYDVLRFVPEESAEHYRFAPLAIVDNALEIGMVDPDDIQAIDALNFIARATGMPFKIQLVQCTMLGQAKPSACMPRNLLTVFSEGSSQ